MLSAPRGGGMKVAGDLMASLGARCTAGVLWLRDTATGEGGDGLDGVGLVGIGHPLLTFAAARFFSAAAHQTMARNQVRGKDTVSLWVVVLMG